ncbi:hypothetical protein GF325_17970 [Candidatus Bathyarchaeota archaeon]|nr:hypothetical protein [Candidatus Bathyarchaeota archaeon]
MNVYVDPVKFAMMFVKLFNCFLSIILANKIRKKNRYVLNQLFFIAFLGWGLFIGTDGILFVIAPLSPGLYLFANFLRDVSIICLGLTPFCLIVGGFVIREGEDIAIMVKKKRWISTFFLSLSIVIGILIFDKILIFDETFSIIPREALPPTNDFTVSYDIRWILYGISSSNLLIVLPGLLTLIFYLSYIAWYTFSAFQMFFIQRVETGAKKKRAIMFMIGILMIPLGIGYFTIIPFLPIPKVFNWIFMLIGQTIWALSPILVFIGFRIKIKAPINPSPK